MLLFSVLLDFFPLENFSLSLIYLITLYGGRAFQLCLLTRIENANCIVFYSLYSMFL